MLQTLHASANQEALYFWTNDAKVAPAVELPGAQEQVKLCLPVGKTLRQRRWTARRVGFADAADWLLHWSGPAMSEFAFWRSAARYALGLLVRQNILPGADGWEGHYVGPEAVRLEQLMSAMPDVCRCVLPLRSRRAVLQAFLRGCLARWTRLPASPQPARPSLHDRWLASLRSGEPLAEAQQAELAVQVSHWQRPLQQARRSTHQVALRLAEPPPDGAWSLQPMLQDVRDPSLLLSCDEVWAERGSLRGTLLLGLGQAAALSAVLATGLQREGEPRELSLTLPEAYQFLRFDAPTLSDAGFAVYLPRWAGRSSRLKLRAKVKGSPLSSSSKLAMHEVLTFDWQVALGGELLSLDELQALARQKQSLVAVRGRWIMLDPEQLEAALRLLEQPQQSTLSELVQLGLDPVANGFEVEAVEAEGAVAELLEKLQGTREIQPIPAPAGFVGELRAYQLRGAGWLDFLTSLGVGACLADDMGLGKTAQTIAWLLTQRCFPALIVCPTSVTGNWARELQRFAPEVRVWLHQGPQRLSGEKLADTVAQHDVCVTSYSLLGRDAEELRLVQWGAVVLDEAQFIKNPQTQAAKAVRSLAGRRVALTGTPVENHVGDLWALVDYLNPGWLGTPTEFKRRFARPIQLEGDPVALDRLRRLTSPLILRRLKTDPGLLPELPEKIELKALCTLTSEQATLYQAAVDEALDSIASSEGIQRKGMVLALLSRLKQICNHPAQFLADGSPLEGRSGKLTRLQELLSEILQRGERCLIFSQFAEMGAMLQTHLETRLGQPLLFLHGGVPAKARTRLVDEFQAENGPAVMILSLKAGGTGLNLTAASHVIHFDRWWNPAVENQATDRAYRLGQQRSVLVHKFVCQGTVEEQIDGILEGKQTLARSLVAGGEEWLSELSTVQLRDLVRLRAEALAE
jgi:SNF2 family DNA or RNA helicase